MDSTEDGVAFNQLGIDLLALHQPIFEMMHLNDSQVYPRLLLHMRTPFYSHLYPHGATVPLSSSNLLLL